MPDKTNPYTHIASCQSSSQIALTCPACRWRLLKWSVPRPGQSLEERLTPADEMWLSEMKISYREANAVMNAATRDSRRVEQA
jgi:hypothetical protein